MAELDLSPRDQNITSVLADSCCGGIFTHRGKLARGGGDLGMLYKSLSQFFSKCLFFKGLTSEMWLFFSARTTIERRAGSAIDILSLIATKNNWFKPYTLFTILHVLCFSGPSACVALSENILALPIHKSDAVAYLV